MLIQGESGTGKEIIAECSPRAQPARPRAVREGELRGAHRDAPRERAVRPREGRVHRRDTRPRRAFKQADGGTIFLDEIGSMSPAVQAKLLRVLQEREFEPVGSYGDDRVDVRVIAATNADLAKAVRRGQVPRGSVLSPQRLSDRAAAASRAQGRHRAPGESFPAAAHDAMSERRSAGSSPEAIDALCDTAGPATCASSRTPSSTRSSSSRLAAVAP